MEHFFSSEISRSPQIQLGEEDRRHLLRSLRKNVGDKITLVDGRGHSAKGTIAEINKKTCKVSVEGLEKIDSPKPEIDLFVGIIKNTKRLELILEKGTELGLRKLIFLQSERSVKTRLNPDRLMKIAISALKQSGQFWLPEISIANKDSLPSSLDKSSLILLAQCFGQRSPIEDALSNPSIKPDKVQILIGPEGDFSPKESEMLKNMGAIPISLGDMRLRTETAAIAALSYLRLKCV